MTLCPLLNHQLFPHGLTQTVFTSVQTHSNQGGVSGRLHYLYSSFFWFDSSDFLNVKSKCVTLSNLRKETKAKLDFPLEMWGIVIPERHNYGRINLTDACERDSIVTGILTKYTLAEKNTESKLDPH